MFNYIEPSTHISGKPTIHKKGSPKLFRPWKISEIFSEADLAVNKFLLPIRKKQHTKNSN
jgi:hypothetical protein